MAENFNFLFQYLDKEDILINKPEFEFQIQSHPNYPTLVSIADTLNFFNIDNGALSIKASEIELLPDRFVALLNSENNRPQFYLMEKKGDIYFIFKNKNKTILSEQELELKWRNTVLLIEKPKTHNLVRIKRNKSFWVFPLLYTIFFLVVIMKFKINLQTKFFFVFPVFGLLFSAAALKDLFGTKSELLNNFCSLTSTSSCSTIINSSKWKIFEIINFSDLSLVFFSSQFFGLLLFLFMADTSVFFSNQKIMLVCSLPVLLTSVYYQKFVEKKWCPICLVIISIILLELAYVSFLLQISFRFSLQSSIIFSFVVVSVISVWFLLKKLLMQQKMLKEFQIKGNRFIRNYEIFKNNLLASEFIDDIPMRLEESIILGDPQSPLKIIMVTNPFCSFCAEAHSIIEDILNRHPKKVFFDIRFNFDDTKGSLKSKQIHQKLLSIYFNQGQYFFMKSLHNWFKNKDENELNILENSMQELKLNLILEKQFNWNQLNHIRYTPTIIINGYFLPKQYERSDIMHFINDLSEDETLLVIPQFK